VVDGHFELVPGHLSLAELRSLLESDRPIRLAETAWSAIERSAEAVSEVLANGRATYGVNTGFGSLATTRIPTESVAALQRNLVLSHAAGAGPLLEDKLVRLILILKINSLSLGYSGVRRSTLELLIAFVNRGILPSVPAQGSVGASGDLAPLAHLSLPLIGEGEVSFKGKRMAAADALAEAGLQPVTLGAKEGLALLNGTRAFRRRKCFRRRHGGRRHVGRCHAGQRRAVRGAHPCGTRPGRSDRRGRKAGRAAVRV